MTNFMKKTIPNACIDFSSTYLLPGKELVSSGEKIGWSYKKRLSLIYEKTLVQHMKGIWLDFKYGPRPCNLYDLFILLSLFMSRDLN